MRRHWSPAKFNAAAPSLPTRCGALADRRHVCRLTLRFISYLTHHTMSFQLPPGMRPAQAPQGGQGNGQDDEERAQRQAQQAEVKRTMIQAMLEPEARERRE